MNGRARSAFNSGCATCGWGEKISERSGAHGIDKIEDFQGWYSEAFQELESFFDEIKAQPSFTKLGVGLKERHGLALHPDSDWEDHKEKISELTKNIYDAWLGKTRGDSA